MKPQIPKSVCTFVVCICAATLAVAQQPSSPEPQPGTIVDTILVATAGRAPHVWSGGSRLPHAAEQAPPRLQKYGKRLLLYRTGWISLGHQCSGGLKAGAATLPGHVDAEKNLRATGF